MQFLCLIYDHDPDTGLPPDDQGAFDEIVRDVLAYRKALADNGHYVLSSPLGAPESARTIKVREGQPIITDGPFAETKDVVGGFYLIEAKDMEEALRLAEQMPPARFAAIEVRPLHRFELEEEQPD